MPKGDHGRRSGRASGSAVATSTRADLAPPSAPGQDGTQFQGQLTGAACDVDPEDAHRQPATDGRTPVPAAVLLLPKPSLVTPAAVNLDDDLEVLVDAIALSLPGTGLLPEAGREPVCLFDVPDVADLCSAVRARADIGQRLDEQRAVPLSRSSRQCFEDRRLIGLAQLAGACDERDRGIKVTAMGQVEDGVLHCGPVRPGFGMDPRFELTRTPSADAGTDRPSASIRDEDLDLVRRFPHQTPGMGRAEA